MLKSGKRKYEKVQEAYTKLKEQAGHKKHQGLQKAEEKNDDEWVTEEEKSQEHELEFEDDFDDEYESEQEIAEEEDEEQKMEEEKINEQKQMVMENEVEDDYVDVISSKKKKAEGKPKSVAFMGTVNDLKEGEQLEVDNHAYEFLHRGRTEWPCLSFDFLLTEQERNQAVLTNENKYPLEVFLVAGTYGAQSKGKSNELLVIGMCNLFSTKNDDDSEDEEEEEEKNTEPKMVVRGVATKAAVNRVKSWKNTGIVACWLENGDVCVYDLQKEFENAKNNQNNPNSKIKKGKGQSQQWAAPAELVKTWKNKSEGFALGWKHGVDAVFATGDNNGSICIYRGRESGWERDSSQFSCNNFSVEDLQFSVSDENVLFFCQIDGSFSQLDLRSNQQPSRYKKAHASDINVMDQNLVNINLIATGDEDGVVKVWDIRMISKSCDPVGEIKWHKGAITGLNWTRREESVLVSAGVDDRVAIWDFAVEEEAEKEEGAPEQLMFVHMGVENVREVAWHPVLKEVVVTTAGNGFNVFRSAIGEGSEDGEEEDNLKVVKEEDLDKFLSKMKI